MEEHFGFLDEGAEMTVALKVRAPFQQLTLIKTRKIQGISEKGNITLDGT